MAVTFINKYSDISGGHTAEQQYAADASARDTLGKSTVSLAGDTLHFDGVNVDAVIPKQGDILYVPSSSAYTPESDGSVPSGTPEGKARFIAFETANDTLMQAAGYESVGVVAAVFGRKVYVVWKNVDTTCKWAEDATESSNSIPNTIDVSSILKSSMEDKSKRRGNRQLVSFDVLRSKLSGEGLPSGQSSWNGGTEPELGTSFFTLEEWTTSDQGSKHPTAEYLAEYGNGVDGWERYLRSRAIGYPSSYNDSIFKDGREETKVLTDINASEERAFFPIANFATTHYTTYGSFGTGKNFWNVPGLRFGDWFMAGAKVQTELFRNVSCSNSSALKESDHINIAMGKISNTRISLYVKLYWLPVLRSRGLAWRMNSGGFFDHYYLSTYAGVLSCALLNY